MTRARNAVRRSRGKLWGARSVAVGYRGEIEDRLRGRPPNGLGAGVNVVGPYDAALGLGEAARGMIQALARAGIPVAPVRMRSAPGQRRNAGLATVSPRAAPFVVSLLYANGDGLRGFAREQRHRFFAGRHSIGVWWCEVAPAPRRWGVDSRVLQEVWVCSEHARQALASVVEVPLTVVPQPVPLPDGRGLTRAQLGLPSGFLFYFAFDYSSTVARKNPLGVVQAFRRAFPEKSDARLVIRSINAQRDPRGRRALEAAAFGRDDIAVIDAYVDPVRRDALLACSDCYVSLHRAEGFGLPLAEAMRLGKPVIATGWSGNLEFMRAENSYLIDYSLSRVGPGAWPYRADALWAEPDLDHAARRMRDVYHDRDEAAARGRRAASDISDHHDPSVVGTLLSERLKPQFEPKPVV